MIHVARADHNQSTRFRQFVDPPHCGIDVRQMLKHIEECDDIKSMANPVIGSTQELADVNGRFFKQPSGVITGFNRMFNPSVR